MRKWLAALALACAGTQAGATTILLEYNSPSNTPIMRGLFDQDALGIGDLLAVSFASRTNACDGRLMTVIGSLGSAGFGSCATESLPGLTFFADMFSDQQANYGFLRFSLIPGAAGPDGFADREYVQISVSPAETRYIDPWDLSYTTGPGIGEAFARVYAPVPLPASGLLLLGALGLMRLRKSRSR